MGFRVYGLGFRVFRVFGNKQLNRTNEVSTTEAEPLQSQSTTSETTLSLITTPMPLKGDAEGLHCSLL